MRELQSAKGISFACVVICAGLCVVDGPAPLDYIGIAVGFE